MCVAHGVFQAVDAPGDGVMVKMTSPPTIFASPTSRDFAAVSTICGGRQHRCLPARCGGLENFEVLEHMSRDVPWGDEVIQHDMEVSEGTLEVPDEPGLGVGFDPDAAREQPGEPKDSHTSSTPRARLSGPDSDERRRDSTHRAGTSLGRRPAPTLSTDRSVRFADYLRAAPEYTDNRKTRRPRVGCAFDARRTPRRASFELTSCSPSLADLRRVLGQL